MKIVFALLAATVIAAPAAAAFTLTNTNAGDGFVTAGPAPYDFTVVGSNNALGSNVTFYTDIATATMTVRGRYSYRTNDRDGSDFDPAGYTVNGSLTQLSPVSSPRNVTTTGLFSFDVAAGDTYGYYVSTTDSDLGAGSISVGAVPEPASWALMIGGFGMVGAAARRRRTLTAA